MSLVLFMAVAARLTGAQAQTERPWHLDIEVGASLFFGASEQATVLTRFGIETNDPLVEYSAGAGFEYGEARIDGRSAVNKRSWNAQTSLDYRPDGRVSPFLFVTAEGSFQRRIDSRIAGGAGGRVRLVETDRARIDASAALLAERTDARVAAGVADEPLTIGRWSGRLRARHTFGDRRVILSFLGFYKPRIDDAGDYTIDVDASLAYTLSSIIGIKVSFVDRYDHRAKSRGARSNNDGRLSFSVLASLR